MDWFYAIKDMGIFAIAGAVIVVYLFIKGIGGGKKNGGSSSNTNSTENNNGQ